MKVLSKSDGYAVVKLAPMEVQLLGIGGSYAVVDVFYDKNPLLKNIIGTFVSMEEAEDWAREHE